MDELREKAFFVRNVVEKMNIRYQRYCLIVSRM